ncbi:hypothetical protein J3R83DRAFT_10989 [Lanmaoa asiatica]|nr:hypothetical protein J3R83DRAFT_10989 [Lanmaoa asiatica]
MTRSTVPFVSQLRSLWQAVTGDTTGAKRTQEEFLGAWRHNPCQQISDLADNVPVVGHAKGLVHLALGQREEFVHSEEAATRSLVVVGAGALTAGVGGVAAPILAGVAAGVAADAAITGTRRVIVIRNLEKKSYSLLCHLIYVTYPGCKARQARLARKDH